MIQSTVRFATVLLSFVSGSIANAQYCAPAVFVGDINQDDLVDNADIKVWNALFDLVPPGYNPCADLNRNGVLDLIDLEQLKTAVLFAGAGPTGLGLNGRIPAFTLSEIRTGQPLITDDQQRFVEFACPDPDSFPKNYNFSNSFEEGYYLLLVSKQNSGSPTNQPQGVIQKVVDLKNIDFLNQLALIKDSSFKPNIPPFIPSGFPVVNMSFIDPNSPDIIFPNQNELNTTWFLVYRRPNQGAYISQVAIPAVGQRIDTDPNTDCQVDASNPKNSLPPPNFIPPWDIVLDAISVDKSVDDPSGPLGAGCIYAHGTLFEAFPIIRAFGELQAPLHVFRYSATGLDPNTIANILQGVTVGIDTPGVQNIGQEAPSCGVLSTGDCTTVHTTPFCNDPDCCTYVCGSFPICCSLEWDQTCADLALIECGICGGDGSGSCLLSHPGKSCSDEICCDKVCVATGFAYCCTVSWDEDCVTKAKLLCLECGSSVLPNSCFEPSNFPYCPDATCCERVCLLWNPCCEVVWDEICVEYADSFCLELTCGSEVAGDCCLAHESPYCNDLNCCDRVCASDLYCCQVSWDVQCVEETILSGCGLTCECGGGLPSDGCFEVHTNPGCNSIRCCNNVCSSDPFCCGVTWDSSCVATARGFCGEIENCETSNASCFVAHNTPGCSTPSCCDAVCAVEPDCCINQWDIVCVNLVPTLCEGCGEPFAGSCLVTHGSPACNDAVCCAAVCAQDNYCCTNSWDGICVDLAAQNCGLALPCGNPQSRSCFVASFVPGCLDPTCCDSICKEWDEFCCSVRWDSICAEEAIIRSKLGMFCRVPPAVPGRGDCSEPHPSKGCSNYQCAAAVCSVRPVCCTANWDEDCVNLVEYVCVATTSCEDTNDPNPLLSPFLVHSTPGTNDYSCCNAVCAVIGFEYCCELSWDANCVVRANALCKYSLPIGAPWCVPASGSCSVVHSTPGCEDESCASAVCFYNAQCCILEWDETCVALARGLCCGTPGCGDHCNGSCIIPHDTPFCSDPFCCTAVCEADPSCCQLGWDFNCVEYAYERCARGCGIAESGSCLTPHKNPGCNNAECCAAICAQDSYCCQEQWDATCAEMTENDPKCDNVSLECGSYLAEYCCSVHLESPSCSDLACCNAVCAADPICCELQWDEICVEKAFENTACPCTRTPCGDNCAGDCCEAHRGPNCRDSVCCEAVCDIDKVCCDSIWDAICAQIAREICIGTCEPPVCGTISAGNCCEPHANANCNNQSCCDLVCDAIPICCSTSWDETCATLASVLCPICSLTCGDQAAGSCYTPHPNPFCEDLECCLRVCQFLPFCCNVEWDQKCADYALIKLCQ